MFREHSHDRRFRSKEKLLISPHLNVLKKNWKDINDIDWNITVDTSMYEIFVICVEAINVMTLFWTR